MAIKRSAWAKGEFQAPVSREGGGVVAEKYKFVVNENLAIGDIVELAILPAFHRVVDAILITDALGASVTADVGVMSGEVGAATNVGGGARTSGAELWSGEAVATAGAKRVTKVDAFRIAPVEAHRSIGVKIGGAAVTASGQVIELVLFTIQ